MPYKDLNTRRIKAREYQAVHRLRAKQKIACLPKEPRFCQLCDISITDKRKDAKFCCRDHKRTFSDSQRDFAAEYAKNTVRRRAQALVSYHANLNKNRAKMLAWQKKNPAIYAANAAKYRASKTQRTPSWLEVEDTWMIEQAYKLAALRTKLFGFSWHVDHVIPLHGKLVSGLHVPTNLQVIPSAQNISKNNKFEVAV